MKTSKIFSLAIIGLLLATLTACKYDDGPSISVLSKKGRLANTWKIYQVEFTSADSATSIDLTANYAAEWELTINKDGSFEKRTNGNIQTIGEWEFMEKKEQFKLIWDNQTNFEVNNITRLKNDELWFYQNVGGDITEFKLFPKN